MPQYQFHKRITIAWLDPKTYWPDQETKKTHFVDLASVASTISSHKKRQSLWSTMDILAWKKKRAVILSNDTLDLRVGKIYCQLSNENHLPEEASVHTKRGLDNYYNRSKSGRVRNRILQFKVYRVHLCLSCYAKFHEIEELVGQKEQKGSVLLLYWDSQQQIMSTHNWIMINSRVILLLFVVSIYNVQYI